MLTTNDGYSWQLLSPPPNFTASYPANTVSCISAMRCFVAGNVLIGTAD